MTSNQRDYISASQLKKWRTCPESYRFRYKSDIEPTRAEKGYRSMGSAVHEAIENVLVEDPTVRSQDKLEFRFENELQNLDYEYPESMHDTAMGCVSNAARYIASYREKFNDGERLTIRGVEVDHKFEVNRPDISYPFRAIMDVTTEGEIWDWKTGNRRPADELLQGAVYLAAYGNKYGEVPEAMRFIYLKDREVETYPRTDDNGHVFWSESKQPDGWDEAIKLAKQLMRAWRLDEWPAKPGDPCYWCSYEMFCSASPVGVGDVNYEIY